MNTENLFPVLCELLLKSAVVLALAGLVSSLWRDASAASRHMVWALALATLLVLPLTKLAVPLWTVKLTTKTTQTVLPPASTSVTPVASAPAMPAIAPAQSWILPPWHTTLVFAWLAGVAAVLGYRFVGNLRLRRLRRQSEPLADQRSQALARSVAAECGLANRVELRRAAVCHVPLAWGIWRPVVLLPDVAIAWSDQQLAAALRHEFGHLRRRDCLARLVSQVACVFYWVNPLVWLAARRLRVAQEQACDDLVLRSGASAPDYAELLVQVARGLGASRLFRQHALAMAQPSTLEARVRAIVDERRNRRPLGRGAVAVGAVVTTALVAACGLAQVQNKPDAKEPKHQVMVEAKIIELPANQAAAVLPAETRKSAVPNPSEPQDIIQRLSAMKDVEILSAPRVITLSGQRAKIEMGNTVRIGKDGSKSVFEGVSLEVLPEVQKDGLILLMSLLTVRQRLPGVQEPLTEQSFREHNVTTTVTLASGHALAVGGEQRDAKGRTLLLLLTASLVKDAGEKLPTPKPSAIEAKARRIVLPHVEFQEAVLADVVNFLMFKSLELDPDKKGVNIIISAPPEAQTARITLNLREVPLLDVLRYTTEITGLRMTAEENAFVLSSAKAPAAGPPRPAAPGGAAAEKAKRIVLPSMEFVEAPLPSVVEFLVAKSRELDPEKVGLTIILRPPPGAKPPAITLNLRNVPLLKALGYIAQLANMELAASDHALRLEPKTAK